jgi:hypothetical protein
LQENEKILNEFQLTNKTLETNLQKKSNEFNNIQDQFNEVEQKNKVKLKEILTYFFEIHHFVSFIYQRIY